MVASMALSTDLTIIASSGVASVKASPVCNARPVRPMRWVYASTVLGMSKLIT